MRETTRHRHAFELYWRLGATRSLERLREALLGQDGEAPSIRTLCEWSRTLGWQERIDEEERKVREAGQEVRREEFRDMNERQVQLGLLFQSKAAAYLAALEHDELSPAAAVRFGVEGVRLEREARGQPPVSRADVIRLAREMAAAEGLDPDQAADDVARFQDETGS